MSGAIKRRGSDAEEKVKLGIARIRGLDQRKDGQ